MTEPMTPEALAEVRRLLASPRPGVVWQAIAADLLAEVDRWWGECDKYGLPHDPEALSRHHRASGAFIAGTEAYAKVREAEAEVDRLRAQVEAARQQHAPADFEPDMCVTCLTQWPCSTYAALASGEQVQPKPGVQIMPDEFTRDPVTGEPVPVVRGEVQADG